MSRGTVAPPIVDPPRGRRRLGHGPAGRRALGARRPPVAHHGSWTTRRAPASTTATTASSSSSWVGAWRPSTVTTTGGTSCSSQAGASRRRCTTTTVRSAVRCGSHGCRHPSPTSPRSPAPIRSTSTATATPTSSCCVADGDVVLRGLGGCRFEPATEQLGIDLRPGWTTAFSATWEGSNQLPTLAFGRYLVPGEDRCDESWLLRPTASGSRYAAPIALVARVLHAVDAVQRLEPLRAPRPPRLERPPLLHDRRGAALAHRPWRATDRVHGGRRLASVADLGHGHRQPGPHGRRPPRGVPHEPGRQQAPDARVRRGNSPTTATSRSARRHRATALHRRRHPPVDGVASGVRRREQRRAQPTCSSRRATSTRRSTRRATTPATCSSAARRLVRRSRAEAAGIVSYDRARGAAVVDLNLDGLLDMVIVNRRANVTLWRNVGRGTAARPAPMGHWIDVRLEQPAPNVDAIGAWLDVRAGRAHDHTRGDGRWRARERGARLAPHRHRHARATAEVRVQWPDGTVGPWMTVPAGERVTIVRGDTAPRPWTPKG